MSQGDISCTGRTCTKENKAGDSKFASSPIDRREKVDSCRHVADVSSLPGVFFLSSLLLKHINYYTPTVNCQDYVHCTALYKILWPEEQN